jgi:hypothetical protein
MAKTKISEFSSTASDNTDITNINIAENCSPANVNNAIRSLMAVLKNFEDGSSGDNVVVGGNFRVDGTTTLVGTALAPTPSSSDNSNKIATTAYVKSNVGTLGAQDASAVAITGGTITGLSSALPVASGGTGLATLTANNVILGNGTSNPSFVAPGTSGNVLTSNGTTWTSASQTVPWVISDVSSSSSISSGTTVYNIDANTVMVLGTAYHSMSGNSGSSLGVRIKNSGGTTLFTYTLTGGNENNGGDGGSGMSSRSSWTVAVPSTAIGGTLEFYRVSGSSSISLIINQVIKSA